MFKLRAHLQAFVFLSALVFGQDTYTPQEVRVSNLPAVTAKSPGPPDVLAASVATIFHDKDLCCGKNSSLEDRVSSADPLSLKDIASKLAGRQHRTDGTPITVTADFWPASAANSGQIVAALRANHALVMEWNSHLYVVYGVLFNDALYNSGESRQEIYVIRKLLLLDLRHSGAQRSVVFDRETDNWTTVQGLLLLDWNHP